MKTGSGEMK